MENRFGVLDYVAVHSIQITQALSAMTAGNIYEGYLSTSPILDSSNGSVGGVGNSSFADSSSVFVNGVEKKTLVVNNGDYYLDHRTGYYYVKAGASTTPNLTWYVKALQTTTTTS